jgi:hypothetical protein
MASAASFDQLRLHQNKNSFRRALKARPILAWGIAPGNQRG